MSSAMKAEIGALYLNAREVMYIRKILMKLGHANIKPRCRLTTLWQMGYLIIKCNLNRQMQWICSFTCCRISITMAIPFLLETG